MVGYSIKDLENLSGVKAHTLRIWEKRYGILTPSRTNSNIRYYTEEDLQNILNISLLNHKGLKISKIAEMPPESIKKRVAEATEVDHLFGNQIDTLMLAMFELNESKFSLFLDRQIHFRGFEDTIYDIVYPLLDKLSIMWVADSIKGVHMAFVSNIIRKKTIVAIDKISILKNTKGIRCLIFLPENDTHELSLLFLEYILLKCQVKVINLGCSTPMIDVLEAKNIFKSSHIFTLFNDSFTDTPLQPYINELAKNATNQQIIISGFQTVSQNLTLPSNVMIINSIVNVKDYILSIVG